ncbi:LuxR C-terminal-related transcriptional regulator [Streptomyces sp. NBC_00198]|uniref:LuxR C-terminal-related transcriptional regulator n=1 Tax=Streptomyces sp. NBC_00198 TaxID=2975677 RepID=UPI00224FADC0|nr:LuxR C-terminal-related transcriptional regulator [Streptomyces sp. NBC_00198]MCX5285955.1 LuxR C-terminal-related transcriptional regulator [Streptomyces sp. NBC_00198]MCX5286264.1 LuxR C-terminal-related transcriptional regulator [Streptomyces sp. NBC_00198]
MAGDTPDTALSPAQISVIAAYARGLHTAQVCTTLGMSQRAVRGHIARAARRAHITGRPLGGLVHHCYQQRLFDTSAYPDLAVRTTAPPPALRLQHRPRIVLGCMAEGLSLNATANELGISKASVMTYRKRIFAQFGTRELPRVIAMGWQWGHLPLRPPAGAPLPARRATPTRRAVVTP